MQDELQVLEKSKVRNENFETTINSPLTVNSINDQFIGIWENIFQEDYCNYLIDLFDKTDFLKYGIDLKRNDIHRTDNQLDLKVLSPALNHHLMSGVSLCLNNYLDWYPPLRELVFFSINNLMQKTQPKGGYHSWHHEQQNLRDDKRCLVWMLYLNDVNDGGETEFLYQSKRVQPKRGTVMIFPAAFTHQHRGNPPLSGSKYIITGWFSSNFYNEELPYYQYKEAKDL